MARYAIEVGLVPGMQFRVEGDTLEELMEQYEFMNGDTSWLAEKVKEIVPATERGEGVGALSAAVTHALEGEVVSEAADEPAEPSGGSENVVERVDPWSGQTVREPARKPRAARSEPSRGSSPHPASRPQRNTGEQGPREEYDRWNNKYVVGLPDAPEDPNGHGPMVLKTWTSQGGKQFTAYKCPNTAPSGNYREKCDAHEWPPR